MIASALDLGVPDAELERTAHVLDALEQSFRPLAAGLPFAAESALTFVAEAGRE